MKVDLSWPFRKKDRSLLEGYDTLPSHHKSRIPFQTYFSPFDLKRHANYFKTETRKNEKRKDPECTFKILSIWRVPFGFGSEIWKYWQFEFPGSHDSEKTPSLCYLLVCEVAISSYIFLYSWLFSYLC